MVAQISKGKDGGGLGISLEGTVDVEDGREVRPHHYIRSVLPGEAGHKETKGIITSAQRVLFLFFVTRWTSWKESKTSEW